MKRALEDFTSWKIFFLVAETGSFSDAAAAADRTASYVTRAIQAMEDEAGEALFDRSQRPCRLTARGEEVRQLVEPAWKSFCRQLELVRAEPVDAPVRVSGPAGMMRRYVMGRIDEFIRSVPKAPDFRIGTGWLASELFEDRCDILITTAPVSDGRIESVPITTGTTLAVASREYLERFGEPGHPRELARHTGILRSAGGYHERNVLVRDGEEYVVRWGRTIESSDMYGICEMVERGLGISIDLPVSMFGEKLASGALVPVLEGWRHSDWRFRAAWLRRGPRARLMRKMAVRVAEEVGRRADESRAKAFAIAEKRFRERDPGRQGEA